MSGQSSTLFPKFSLRESIEPFEGVCYAPRHDAILTVEPTVLRLWSTKKQIKSIRYNYPSKDSMLLNVEYNEAMDCFIFLYGTKKTSHVRCLLQFWFPSLSLAQEIEVDLDKILLTDFCPKKKTIGILDISCNINIIQLEIIPEQIGSKKKSSGPFAKEPSDSKDTMKVQIQSPAHLPRPRRNVARIIQKQIIKEAYHYKDISTLKFIEDTSFVIIMNEQFIIYSSQYFSDTEGDMYSKIRSIDLYILPSLRATCIQRLSYDTYAIGFTDNLIRIYSCDIFSNDIYAKQMKIMCGFKAHETATNKYGVTAIKACTSSTIGGNGYILELFTTGGDNFICHWAVRRNPLLDSIDINSGTSYSTSGTEFDPSLLIIGDSTGIGTGGSSGSGTDGDESSFVQYDVPYIVDLLGKQKLPTEPSSHVKTKLHSPDLHARGLLTFYEIHAPNKSVILMKDEIVCAVSGPPPLELLCESDEELNMNTSELTSDCFAILSDEVVDFISSESSTKMHRVFTSHLQDMEDPMYTLQRISDPADRLRLISKEKATRTENNWLEGRPTSLCWCPYTFQIVIGFSSGGAGLVSVRKNSSGPHILINSRSVHGVGIRTVATFLLPCKTNTNGGGGSSSNVRAAALLGDQAGALSVWQIAPRRLQGKLWSCQAHQGAVVAVRIVSLQKENNYSSNNNNNGSSSYSFSHDSVLVTACAAGVVKTWLPSPEGILTMIGFFSTRVAIASLVLVEFSIPIPNTNMNVNNNNNITSTDNSQSIPQNPYRTQTEAENSAQGGEEINNNTVNGNGNGKENVSVVTSTHSEPSVSSHFSLNSSVEYNNNNNSIPKKKTEKEVQMLFYICGLSTGAVESWSLSNKKKGTAIEANCSTRMHNTSVNAIETIPIEFCYSSSSPSSPSEQKLLLSAAFDGTLILFEIKENGIMNKLKTFSTEYSLYRMILRPVYSSNFNHSTLIPLCLEAIVFSDKNVNRILIIASRLSTEWYNEYSNCIGKDELQSHAEYNQHKSILHIKQQPRIGNLNVHGVGGGGGVRGSDGGGGFMSPKGFELPLLLRNSDDPQETTPIDTDSVVTPSSTLPEDEIQTPALILYDVDGYRAQLDDQLKSALGVPYEGQEYNDFILDIHGIKDPLLKNKLMEKLHLAKKNARLLEAFTQFEDKKTHMISAMLLPDLLERWMRVGSLSKDSVMGLMDVLHIQLDTNLSFFDVTKLAASLAYAIKFNPGSDMNTGEVKGRLKKTYRDMQTVRTAVRYNSMGEKVVEKIPLGQLAPGIFNGYINELTALWGEQPSRVPVHINEDFNSRIFPETKLIEIPESFRPLLHGNLKLSKHWTPSMEHWFDLRRTIRVARTIIDMRLSAQQDFILRKNPEVIKHLKQNKKKEVIDYFTDNDIDMKSIASLPICLITYFERNYGTALKNIAQQKVIHFLEACLQYSEYPLLNFLKRFLCPETAMQKETLSETCLWFYIESYNFLKSHGSIIEGNVIQSHDPIYGPSLTSNEGGGFSSSYTNNGSALLMHWNVVYRHEAIRCIEEMFNIRGKYGPKVIESMKNIIYNLEAAIYTNSNDITNINNHNHINIHSTHTDNDLLDLDTVLEILTMELNQIDIHLDHLNKVIFGEGALPPTRAATARDIIGEDGSRSPTSSPPKASPNSIRNRRSSVPDEMLNILHRNDLLRQLQVIKDFILLFIDYDSHRTGRVPQYIFKELCYMANRNFLESNSSHAIDVVIDVAIKAYSDPIDGSVSYVDLWATLLAYVTQQLGDGDLGCENITEAILTVRRGIDQHQWLALQEYLSYLQCPAKTDPLWTCGIVANFNRTGQLITTTTPSVTAAAQSSSVFTPLPGSGVGTATSMYESRGPSAGVGAGAAHQLAIPTQGMWKPALSRMMPSVGPGALTIQRITLERQQDVPHNNIATSSHLSNGNSNVNGSEIWWDREITRTKDKSRTSTVSLSTKPAHVEKNTPLPLHTQELSSSFTVETSEEGEGSSEVNILTLDRMMLMSSKAGAGVGVGVGGGGLEPSSAFNNFSSEEQLAQSDSEALFTDNNNPTSLTAGTAALRPKSPTAFTDSSEYLGAVEIPLLESLLNDKDLTDLTIHSALRSISRNIDRTQHFGDRASLSELSGRPIDQATRIHLRSPFEDPYKEIISITGEYLTTEESDLEKRVLEFRERIRRPPSEQGAESMVGRYTAQGRAVSPILTSDAMGMQDMDMDIYRERDRLHAFRQERIRNIHHQNIQHKMEQMHGKALPAPMDTTTNASNTLSSSSSLLRTSQNFKKNQMLENAMAVIEQQLEANIAKEEEDLVASEKDKQAAIELRLQKKLAEKMLKKEIEDKLKDENKKQKELEKHRADEAQRQKDEIQQKKTETAAKRALHLEEEKKHAQEQKDKKLAKQKELRALKDAVEIELHREREEQEMMLEEDELSALIEDEIVEREIRAKQEEEAALLAEQEAIEEEIRLAKEAEEAEEALRKEQEDEQIRQELELMAEQDEDAPAELSEEDDEFYGRSLEDEEEEGDGVLEEETAEGCDEDEVELEDQVEDGIDENEGKFKPPTTDLSTVQRKLRDFLDRMDIAAKGNKDHPRKHDHENMNDNDNNGNEISSTTGKFFMPFLFAPDIVFNPFDSHMYPHDNNSNDILDNKVEESVEVEVENEVDPNDFSDVLDHLERKQVLEKEEMLKQLYKTSKDAVPPELWTNVVRMNRIDWELFFKKEQEKFLLSSSSDGDNSDDEFFGEMAKKKNARRRSLAHSSVGSLAKYSSVMGIFSKPNTAAMSMDTGTTTTSFQIDNTTGIHLDDIEDVSQYIQPLPYGHVHCQAVEPDTYHFFQVEVPDPFSVLTVELKCRKGTANLFLAKDNIATEVLYDYKALCYPKDPSTALGANANPSAMTAATNRRFLRLVVCPHKDYDVPFGQSSTFIVSVHGTDMGALFSIWTYATTNEIPKSTHMTQSGIKIMNDLKQLSLCSTEEIADKITKFNDDARRSSSRDGTSTSNAMATTPKDSNSMKLPFTPNSSSMPPLEPSSSRLSTDRKFSRKSLDSAEGTGTPRKRRVSGSNGVGNGNGLMTSKDSTKDFDFDPNAMIFNNEIKDGDDDDKLLEVMVSKRGRQVMRHERELQSHGALEVGEDSITLLKNKTDPNFHSDLFLPPKLPIMPSPLNSGRDSSNSNNIHSYYSPAANDDMNMNLKTRSSVTSSKIREMIDNIPSSLPLRQQLDIYDQTMTLLTGHTYSSSNNNNSKKNKTISSRTANSKRTSTTKNHKKQTNIGGNLPYLNVNLNNHTTNSIKADPVIPATTFFDLLFHNFERSFAKIQFKLAFEQKGVIMPALDFYNY
eukprot:gene134-216_t